jgi:hypothetical protein
VLVRARELKPVPSSGAVLLRMLRERLAITDTSSAVLVYEEPEASASSGAVQCAGEKGHYPSASSAVLCARNE